MLSEKARKYLRWAGSALSVISIFFVIAKLEDYANEIDYRLLVAIALPLIGLSLAYCAANFLLVFAWRNILKHFGVSVQARSAIRIYGLSQLAKYVPGNIFHFVGRQALGLDAGLPVWPLAKSAIWEIGILAITGSIFVVLILPVFQTGIPVVLSLVIFVTVLLATAWMSNIWLSRWIAKALVWDAIFLALAGIIFYLVQSLIMPEGHMPGSTFLLVCGAYVVAWLAGLVTPGSPAGAGIREVVLFALLHRVITESDLLSAVVLGRVVTVSGDIAFYLLALTFKPQDLSAA